MNTTPLTTRTASASNLRSRGGSPRPNRLKHHQQQQHQQQPFQQPSQYFDQGEQSSSLACCFFVDMNEKKETSSCKKIGNPFDTSMKRKNVADMASVKSA